MSHPRSVTMTSPALEEAERHLEKRRQEIADLPAQIQDAFRHGDTDEASRLSALHSGAPFLERDAMRLALQARIDHFEQERLEVAPQPVLDEISKKIEALELKRQRLEDEIAEQERTRQIIGAQSDVALRLAADARRELAQLDRVRPTPDPTKQLRPDLKPRVPEPPKPEETQDNVFTIRDGFIVAVNGKPVAATELRRQRRAREEWIKANKPGHLTALIDPSIPVG